MNRLLALIEAPDHVCYRYRLRAFQPALAEAGWSVEVASLEGTALARHRLLRRASGFDAVVLQRRLLPAWQFTTLRRHAKRLIFDFDDAVLYRDSYHPRGFRCPRRARRFARTVRAADAVLAGNDFLAEAALKHGARPLRVHVLPTCIETHRYPSDHRGRNDDFTDLVWVGSSSTVKGLEQRGSLLNRIGEELPQVRLRLICDRFPTFGALPTLPIRWTEGSEVAELSQGDVGVSLVPDDLWTRGKCALKLLQYQAAGIPVLADPVGVHTQVVRPGFNGLLPRSDDDWVEALRDLASRPERRRAMGRTARSIVEREYSVDAWRDRFTSWVTGQTDREVQSSTHFHLAGRTRRGVV
jgi:glycosyltransferase involved in cell wall biosynthesis